MSDPIRSISQNNYILATQREVSHDNTLTGNGTPESPLGVANSSDETVLWTVPSGYENSNGYDITLSESIHNFEEIAIYCKCVRIDNSLQATTKNTYPVSDPGYTMFADGVSTNHWNIKSDQNGHYTCGVDIRLTDDSGYVGENYRWSMANESTYLEGQRTSNNSIWPHPYKIVGIKRRPVST